MQELLFEPKSLIPHWIHGGVQCINIHVNRFRLSNIGLTGDTNRSFRFLRILSKGTGKEKSELSYVYEK
jgi:hypothetical protein